MRGRIVLAWEAFLHLFLPHHGGVVIPSAMQIWHLESVQMTRRLRGIGFLGGTACLARGAPSIGCLRMAGAMLVWSALGMTAYVLLAQPAAIV